MYTGVWTNEIYFTFWKTNLDMYRKTGKLIFTCTRNYISEIYRNMRYSKKKLDYRHFFNWDLMCTRKLGMEICTRKLDTDVCTRILDIDVCTRKLGYKDIWLK